MKRSGQIKRKTPMPRPKKAIRRVSKKRARLMSKVRNPRAEFLKRFTHCPICGQPRTMHVHEIASGPAREAALSEPCAQLPACDYCNSHLLTDHRIWPIAKQLAIKAVIDPENYDRKRVNELRGRAEDAISEVEVIQAATTLPPERPWQR